MTGETILDVVFIGLVLILLLTFEKSTESTLGGSEAELVLIVLKYMIIYYIFTCEGERSCENRVDT